MKRRNLTILVVDDSEDDLMLLQRAILRCSIAGVSIQKAVSGNEALEYLRGMGIYEDRDRFSYPTFILTDLKMPDGDGFVVLEHLQASPQSAVIPTVVISASADTDDIKRAYTLGASAYLVKPTNVLTLTNMIQTLMAFWMICEVPEVDSAGNRLNTESTGKLGQRFTS
ncbi:response regulator [Kaarinaea lacus]